MIHAKQPGQPIENTPVEGMRWYPPQITSQFSNEKAFVAHWIDKDVYPEITDKDKRELVLKTAWQEAIANIEANEKSGTPIVERPLYLTTISAEKKK